MDNFDFVAHLADSTSALDASVEMVEAFIRSYFREMQAVVTKWSEADIPDDQLEQAFSEVNAVHRKYWLADTRFSEYWQPAIGRPNEYSITDSGITGFSDMLGNFIAIVGTPERTPVYLVSVVRDELKIVNKFFR